MFVNDKGVIRLSKPFPERMSWKRALGFSVDKWEFILSEVISGNRVYDNGETITCALCKKRFAIRNPVNGCRSICPVAKKTGEGGCDGTPYYDVDFDKPETVKAELDFLKSL